MNRFEVVCPTSMTSALALMQPSATGTEPLTDADRPVWLAGGQSLLAAMRLGMAAPGKLVDLQDVPDLRSIRIENGADGQASLWIGAMATHASVAASEIVRDWAPGLAHLAGHIADAQVRNMGTIGGSLAHNDPAACWPAGVLSSGAVIVTSQRDIPADAYFQGLYSTALTPGELIQGVRFPRVQGFHYVKFEQPASRFGLVGVAVTRTNESTSHIRVAVTGLGTGVIRWRQAELALEGAFDFSSLQALEAADAQGRSIGLEALGDLHASATYRCHLALVLVRQSVAALTGRRPPPRKPLSRNAPLALNMTAQEPTFNANVDSLSPLAGRDGFGGQQMLHASVGQVWQAILDPSNLSRCIPGCEGLTQLDAVTYQATVKVGLGPLSVRFNSDVRLRDLVPPRSLTLIFEGKAGALGSGQGTARVLLEPTTSGGTQLHWWVQVQLGGRLAQFGNRLVEGSARQLSEVFFDRLSAALGAPVDAAVCPRSRQDSVWVRMYSWLKDFFQRKFFVNRK